MNFEEYKRQVRENIDQGGRQISDNLIFQMYISDTADHLKKPKTEEQKKSLRERLFGK